MEQYTIRQIQGTPQWEQIPALSVKNAMWTDTFGIRMEQKMCYREDRLYIRQQAWEEKIRAENRGPLDQVCEDSCMEFFLSPQPGDMRYFNWEINLLGNLHLGFHRSRADAVRLIVKEPQKRFNLSTQRTQDGWIVEYEIPADFIALFYPGFRFREGNILRGNCYKCGDLTENEHYLSWNPISSEHPDFHRPQDFGEFLLK